MKALDIGLGLGKAALVMQNEGSTSFGIEPSEPFHVACHAEPEGDAQRFQLASVEEAQFPAANSTL